MPDTPSIHVNKIMTYRGLPEEWSNRYHFLGTTPADTAAWKALAIAIWNEERKMLGGDVKFNGFAGYAAGNEVAVAIMGPDDLDTADKTAGTLTSGSGAPAGDQAIWVRWATGTRGPGGRPKYLRKYFHGFAHNFGDNINTTTRTAALAYGAKMIDGTLPGGFKVCAPQGDVGKVVRVPTSVTTRTLKRRGGNPG